MDYSSVIRTVKAGIATLVAERERLHEEVAQIEGQMATLVGSPLCRKSRSNGIVRKFKRFKNERTLLGTMQHVMGKKAYSVDEIVQMVIDSGYKSRGDARSMKVMVFQKLYVSGTKTTDGRWKIASF